MTLESRVEKGFVLLFQYTVKHSMSTLCDGWGILVVGGDISGGWRY